MMKADGWVFKRHGGKHDVYNLKGQSFLVPRHGEIKSGIVTQYHKKMKEIGG